MGVVVLTNNRDNLRIIEKYGANLIIECELDGSGTIIKNRSSGRTGPISDDDVNDIIKDALFR